MNKIRNKKGQFERKPVDDGCKKWCNCKEPNLTKSFDGKHQATCLNCMQFWYN